jgi:hypothetical protein
MEQQSNSDKNLVTALFAFTAQNTDEVGCPIFGIYKDSFFFVCLVIIC